MIKFKLLVMRIVCAMLVICFGVPFVQAKTLDSEFIPVYHFDNNTLVLSGVGVLKYMGFIRIYNGALYLPPNLPSDQVLEDVAKRLEVKYLRSFKAEDFGTATIAGIKKNIDSDEYQRIASRIDYHNRLYEDIAPGDRVSLTYIPSIGTRVGINGKEKGVVHGADFAAALFSLWLGNNPFDNAFKQALLGNR